MSIELTTILLISGDPRTLQICRAGLDAMRGNDRNLICARPEDVLCQVDLYIWDLDSGAELPNSLYFGQEPQHIFLIRREQLSVLKKRYPGASYAVLVKPLTDGSFRSVIEPALARCASVSSDRDELLQFLLEANVRLQEYDLERTNFLARGLHDLRAPLTALNGYCGLLLDGELGPLDPCHFDVLNRMQHSLQRLSRMTDAMFQLSISSRVDRKPELHESDIRGSIDRAVQEFVPLFGEKQIELRIDTKTSPEPLRFEASQIEQALLNVLDNACKFTPRHGLIKLAGYPFFWERRSASGRSPVSGERRMTQGRTPNSYRIDIHDSGPGIPPGQNAIIFEEYTSSVGDQDRSGAGLGLAICKLILTRHHGRVWAESDGEGATFSLVLPFARKESLPGTVGVELAAPAVAG